jgi:membrane-associated phospholipid phosphatase
MKRIQVSWIVSTGAVLLATAASVIWLDGPAAHHFQPRFGDTVHVMAARWTDLGKAEPYFLLSAILAFGSWGVGRFFQTPNAWISRARNWGVQALAMFLFSGVLVQVFKHIIGRKRPYAVADLSPHEFHPLTANYEFHSMPSGHSQVVFTAATVLTMVWPKAWMLWYGFAALLAASRVVTLNHWISDTVAGAFFGIVGALVARRYLQTTRFQVG